ncbi:ATPase of the PP-loop superfamily protein [Vibrio ichthyoenteri ATCC 700023]|uniref:ATPase of the PP-loop superfamily protein n=1 Tax=Vibrio ichthyoenteri ATCC 700023 TaxID=870968 RepID=F9S4Y8_9VIBR|nr:ATPase [Vibrio ichthyoenteri]EGU36162.1 ATPase of the PP-loop superfamily protein [Vibrio ichthyoenteri ATCC 700023]
MKNIIVSWSSGKDSTLTLERLIENDQYHVVGLFTTYLEDEVPFQATPIEVVEMQADLLGLPLVKIALPEVFPSNEQYKLLVVEGLQASSLPFEAVAFGDMFCNGIAEYRRSYIEPAGWQCVFPLMGEASEQLAQEIIERGIKTMLVTADGDCIARELCGRWYDEALLAELSSDVDPCGENGEFHTLVTQTRSFDGVLELQLSHIEHGERFSHQRYSAKALRKANRRV